MHAARLTSDRLQRVLCTLRDGAEKSTRDIILEAEVMAVSACVAELRQHGAEIDCIQRVRHGKRVWFYTLKKEPDLS